MLKLDSVSERSETNFSYLDFQGHLGIYYIHFQITHVVSLITRKTIHVAENQSAVYDQRGCSLHLIHLFSNYKYHVIFVSKILGTPSTCTRLTEKENVAPTLNSLKTDTWGKREKCWDSSKRSILSLSDHPHCSWGVVLPTLSSSSVAKK